jgi:hypothetical protein
METTKYCAFNKSRETFLTLDARILDAATDPLKVLRVLIEGLGSETRTGLWLTNFKAIPVARTLSPFDLVYLDENHRVVHAVELTTDGVFEPFNGEPDSAIVLPPSTIASTQTQTGDQLIIVATPEAKPAPDATDTIHADTAPSLSLAQSPPKSIFGGPPPVTANLHAAILDAAIPDAGPESESAPLDRFLQTQSQAPPVPTPLAKAPSPVVKPLTASQIASLATPPVFSTPPIEIPIAPLPPQQLQSQPESATVEARSEQVPSTASQPSLPPPPAPIVPPVDTSTRTALPSPPKHSLRSRVRHWLFPEPDPSRPRRPRDRRRAHRLSTSDLVAYFFTGGAPYPHKITDISITGFYMQSDDLWMPGTIMRMTIQKTGTQGDNPADSITVHSRVVRHGVGGGAFEFVLSGFLDRSLPNSPRAR